MPPYWITKFQSVKIGFIGMTLEATDTLVAQAGIQGWSFMDEAETANALVPELKRQGVEAIVVLLHEGGSQTPAPGDVNGCDGISGPIATINAALDHEIDVLISGHTHLPYNCVLDDRIVTSAFSFGRVVTEVDLVLDKRTNDVRRDLSAAVNHPVIRAQITADPAITDVINKWRPLSDVIGNEEVGRITGDITRAFTPGGAEDRGSESDLGNMIADAQQWATQANGAQIAFMNPGGLRSDLIFASSGTEGHGVVTFEEAFNVQPFSNILMTFPMTGAQIIAVLEEQCQPAGVSRPFLHLGVSNGFTYDLTRTIELVDFDDDGEIDDPVCTSITVENVELNGVPLDPNTTYTVTANNFLADGGDNFVTFRDVDPTLRIGGGIDLDELNNYLGSEGPIAPPGTDRANELP